MKPLINPGDQLIIKPVVFSQIRIAEIVVFKDRKRYICHRVLWRTEIKLHVKGDNSSEFDPPIERPQLLGKLFATKSTRGVIRFDSRKSLAVRYYYWLCSWLVFLIPAIGYKLALLLIRGRGLLARLQIESEER